MAVPRVVLLDVNETLTDMSPVRERFLAADLPAELFLAWFAGTLRDGMGLAAAGAYAEFSDIARDTLAGLLAGRDLRQPVDEVIASVLGALPELDLHADVPAGLRQLHEAGVRLATLTNGSAEMSTGAFQRSGVLDLLEHRLSVREPRRWKPAAAAYAYALAVCGVEPSEAALVATHPWDIDGARRAGLVGAFLDRRGAPYPAWALPPDVGGRTLGEVAQALLAER